MKRQKHNILKNVWEKILQITNDEKVLIKVFSNYYINIVKKTSGKPVENSFKNYNDNFKAVLKIIKKYKNIKVF